MKDLSKREQPSPSLIEGFLRRVRDLAWRNENEPGDLKVALEELIESGEVGNDTSRLPEELGLDRSLIALVDRVLGDLPDHRMGLVFHLWVFEQQTLREIGEKLSLSPARVHSLCKQSATALNATIAMKSLNDPFALKSDFSYAGDPVKLTIDVPSPRAYLEKKSTLMTLLFESEKLTAKLNGAVDPVTSGIKGKLDAKGPSVRKLAAWVGSPIGDGGGLQSFAVIGDVSVLGPTTTLTNARLAIDAARGTGNLTITTPDGAPPYVSGTLALSALDVNPYLAAPQTPGAADAAGGVNVNKGWGKEKIDLSGLKSIDADLNITTGQLTFQKMKIDKADLVLNLKDGVMKTTMRRLDLYGGVGAGVLLIDARGPFIKLQNTLNVNGIAAKPFLTDATGFDKIEGTAKIEMAIGAAGDNQQALMSSVVGKTNFTFTNGALVGVNLAQIARQVQSALTGAAVGPAAKTDFAEAGADFTITKGVAHTDNVRMLNPFIRISGGGDVNLGAQTMDMKIIPKAVKTIEGQGGKQEVAGVGIPFHIKGEWAKLKFVPDLGGLVQDQIDKALGGAKLPDLGSLFGQKPKPAPAP